MFQHIVPITGYISFYLLSDPFYHTKQTIKNLIKESRLPLLDEHVNRFTCL